MSKPDPESRLDRIARDLSRTWLHGSRLRNDAAGAATSQPAARACGQQIAVEVPLVGDMRFEFTVQGVTATVPVSHDDASDSQKYMTRAVHDDSRRYLSLAIDSEIPTWVFAHKQFSTPNPQPAEDKIDIEISDPTVNPPVQRSGTVAKLPTAALQEMEDDASCFVSLWSRAAGGDPVIVPRSNWQPALLLRMPLKGVEPDSALPAGIHLFELGGIPQSDRFYLDRLGLLAALTPQTPSSPAPEIAQLSFLLEKKGGAPARLNDWTILRTNLTHEARAQARPAAAVAARVAAAAAQPLPLPYVAVAGQDADALRLIQMGSITNAGGYFLRSSTNLADADSLVIAVLLKPVPDASREPESAWLPMAANAMAYVGAPAPDTIRFNGLAHIQAKPFAASGQLAFGWTRAEPSDKATPEDKFGFGTISLLEYSATGPVPLQAEFSPAISPSNPPSGDSFDAAMPVDNGVVDGRAATALRARSPVAAFRLLSSHYVAHRNSLAAHAAAAPDTVVTHFRSSFDCRKSGESPYAPIGDSSRNQVTFVPGFRDVFGNRFRAVAAPAITRRLFYTDALINPSEWPGIRFGLYCSNANGKPSLTLEATYCFVTPSSNDLLQDRVVPAGASGVGYSLKERQRARSVRLNEIINQLNGVDGDVDVTLNLDPLVASPVGLDVPSLVKLLGQWVALELANADPKAAPIVVPLKAVQCDGSIAAITKFLPSLTITRANAAYSPAPSELPDDGVLARIIGSQVTATCLDLALQRQPTPATAAAGSAVSDNEFSKIARAFGAFVGVPLKARVGFLRDRLNIHRLYFVPENAFPEVSDPTTYVEWSMATPRPLSTKLASETFEVPDFASADANGWNGHPFLKEQLFVDQDLDQLTSAAFRLIERESTDLGVISLAGNADQARSLLKAREQLALNLSQFGMTESEGYLVPLFADAPASSFDSSALQRAAQDFFLGNLAAFYSVGTCLQLPLVRPGNSVIQAFEGAVEFAGANSPMSPTFSQLLLHGGDTKATLFYSLPPGASEAGDAVLPDSLVVKIRYVQLESDTAGTAAAGNNLFNQGAWIELPDPFELKWKCPPEPIPVAARTFPEKPVLQSNDVATRWMGEHNPPPKIDKRNVAALAQWGWSFAFAAGKKREDTQRIHIEVRYNEPVPAGLQLRQAALARGEWAPRTLLQALISLKSLGDNWGKVESSNALTSLTALTTYLVGKLQLGQVARVRDAAVRPISDFLRIKIGPDQVPEHDDQELSIMKGGAVSAAWSEAGSLRVATIKAPPESVGNAAFLTGSDRVWYYRVILKLKGNEDFGTARRPGNAALIYECAPVESAREVWAQNRWLTPLQFDMTGLTLKDALSAFFEGLLRDSPLGSIKVEVTSSLAWRERGMNEPTPFSLLPSDFSADNSKPLSAWVSDSVLDSFLNLPNGKVSKPADVEWAALRLNVKVSQPDDGGQINGRTLLEISRIDFELS